MIKKTFLILTSTLLVACSNQKCDLVAKENEELKEEVARLEDLLVKQKKIAAAIMAQYIADPRVDTIPKIITNKVLDAQEE